MTVVDRTMKPRADLVRTTSIRVHDVFRETVSDMDGRSGMVREIRVTQPVQPAWITYDGQTVAVWVITGESRTAEGEPYMVKRVATTHQEWSVTRP